MKFFPFVVFSVLTILVLTACNGGSSSSGGTPPSVPTFDLTCDMTLSFTPVASPIVTAGTGTPDTTVIALHGKNGSALSSTVATLATDLSAQGYDVIRPYMPWSNFNWTGSLCDAIAYLNSLIETEINAGNSVILLGHSLGNPIIWSYAALSNTTKPDAIVGVAPAGHFVGVSMNFDNLHAADVTRAENMVIAGDGDVIDTFQTVNGGTMQNISTTPNIYLSYHSPDQFPDIRSSISLVNEPTLWLAGDTDPLTSSAINLGVIDVVNTKSNFDYRVITGDHFTIIDNVTGELDPWYQALP